jgi:hypothetical protein
MKLFLVKEDGRPVWSALVNEHRYRYVADTRMCHDNNALRNYQEISGAEARLLIDDGGIGLLDEEVYADVLAQWRADHQPPDPAGFSPWGSR